jgi:hypothetical protein
MLEKSALDGESDDEFDITQSLLTLQLKNPSRPLLNKRDWMVFNQWDKSKKVEYNLRGITKEDKSYFRRNSNIANGSQIEVNSMDSE